MTRRSKDEFVQQSSLSQKLAHMHPEYSEYAGTDQEISETLAIFNVLDKHKVLDMKQPMMKLVKDLLNERRKAIFATSPLVNEITKMGLQMPKEEPEVNFDESG